MSDSIKVAAYDPGRINDGFGMLSATIDSHNIFLGNAKAWFNTDADDVATQIAEIDSKAHFDYNLCEANNTGKTVIDLMKRYHGVYCMPISNVRELSDIEKLKQVGTMPKNATVGFVEYLMQEDILQMPSKPWNDGMKMLWNQIENYIAVPSNTGVSYRAADDNVHDDLITCLLILCHFARRRILSIGYADMSVFAVNKSRAYTQIQNMYKDEHAIREEKTLQTIKKSMEGRIPSNYKMKINGRSVD